MYIKRIKYYMQLTFIITLRNRMVLILAKRQYPPLGLSKLLGEISRQAVDFAFPS